MSISVKNVTKIYGNQKALNDVSFEIGSSEVVGFLGPNGAGKSTMMKIITCYIPQSSGDIKVCGFDVNESSIEVRKNVGYLPEHNPLYLDMYVQEYLKFIGEIHKIPNHKKRVLEMIDMVGLEKEQHKKIGALSKGYRQRVGLAQSMIHDPKVLILDEPTSGLDPNQLVEIRNLIKEIGKEKTVMLSTHIMQEVEAICNRVIIINQGSIVANDNTSEIQQMNQGTGYVLKVELNQGLEKQLWLEIEGVKEVKSIDDKTVFIQTDTEDDIREKVFNFAVSNKRSVLTMLKEERSLEDVFKELTK